MPLFAFAIDVPLYSPADASSGTVTSPLPSSLGIANEAASEAPSAASQTDSAPDEPMLTSMETGGVHLGFVGSGGMTVATPDGSMLQASVVPQGDNIGEALSKALASMETGSGGATLTDLAQYGAAGEFDASHVHAYDGDVSLTLSDAMPNYDFALEVITSDDLLSHFGEYGGAMAPYDSSDDYSS